MMVQAILSSRMYGYTQMVHWNAWNE